MPIEKGWMLKRVLVLSIAVLAITAMYVACDQGGSRTSGASTAAPSPTTTPQAQTVQLTLLHGSGFVCWITPDGTQLWCWASETDLSTTPYAVAMGLTATPQLIVTAVPGYTVKVTLRNEGIIYAYDSSGASNVLGTNAGTDATYTEQATCTVLSTNSVHCTGEDNPNLTFSGLSQPLSRIEHTPTYRRVRRSC